MEKNYGKVSKQNIVSGTTSKKITIWAFMLMAMLMIFSFANIVYDYVGLGWSTAPAFVAAILIYFIPFTLVIAEFASLKKAKGSKSGLMRWITIGAGRKIAFLTVFMFWFANLTFFIAVLPGYAVGMGFAFTGRDITETDALNILAPVVGTLMFCLITFLSTRSIRQWSKVTTVGGALSLSVTCCFFAVATIAYILMLSNGSGSYGSVEEPGFVVTANGPVWFSAEEGGGVWAPSWSNYNLSLLISNENSTTFGDALTEQINYLGNNGIPENFELDKWFSLSTILDNQGIQLFNDSVMRFKITDEGGDIYLWLDHIYVTSEAPGVVNKKMEPNFFGSAGGFGYVWFTIFIWVIMACDGAQALGVYVDDIKGGQRTFIKGLISIIMVIGTMYVFGTILASVFPGNSLSNADYVTLGLMFYYVMGNVFGLSKETSFMISNCYLGILYTITGCAGLILWSSAPVRALFTDTDTGVLGSYITKKNKNGVPYRGAWLQFFVVVPLMVIPFVGLNGINQFLDMIKTAGGSLGMLPPIMIFMAYINLRLKHDEEERTFRVGSRAFGLFMGTFVLMVYMMVFLIAFFPYDPTPNSNWWVGTALNVVAIVFVFIPVLFWYLFFEIKQRNIRIAIRNNLDPALIQIHYSKNKYLFAGKEEKIRKQLQLDIHTLQKKYNVLYEETLLLDLDLKVKKSKLHDLDKKYKKEYKEIMNAFKLQQKDIHVHWKEQGQLEFEKLVPFIEYYKNNIKQIKRETKLAHKEQLKVAIDNFKQLDPKVKKAKQIEYKESLKILKEKQLAKMNELVAKKYELIGSFEEKFVQQIAQINSKDTILEFRAARDANIALEKFHLSHEKIILREKQKEEILKLKSQYLGEKYLIKLQIRKEILKAIKNSEKRFIDNFYITEYTNYGVNNYKPSTKAKSYSAIRQCSIFNPKTISDKIIVDGNRLVVQYLLNGEIITDVYRIKDVNLYLDLKEKVIHPVDRADPKNLMLVQLVNNDKFITLHDEFFVENYKDLSKVLKAAKAAN